MTSPPLPHHLHARLSADQWELLEETAQILDLTMSGAMRWHLDQVLDKQLGPERGAPTRRELLREKRDEGVSIPSKLATAFAAAPDEGDASS